MDSKLKSGQDLREFCREFGIPYHLNFNGSKEQSEKGTEFMKTVNHYGIDHHISYPDIHNQNPVEGVIREIQKKWYCTMVTKRSPRQFSYYGVMWC